MYVLGLNYTAIRNLDNVTNFLSYVYRHLGKTIKMRSPQVIVETQLKKKN